MKEIISYGNKEFQKRLKFTCYPCGCIFYATQADYERKALDYEFIKNNPNLRAINYKYQTTCPMCGTPVDYDEQETEIWEIVIDENGEQSLQKR